MAAKTIFEKLIAGELPCARLLETDAVFAFMALHAIRPGHTLIIPKQPVADFWDLDDAVIQQIMQTAKRIARAIEEIYQPKRVGMVVAGLEIPDHAHLHLLPVHDLSDISSKSMLDGTLQESPLAEREDNAAMIRAALE